MTEEVKRLSRLLVYHDRFPFNVRFERDKLAISKLLSVQFRDHLGHEGCVAIPMTFLRNLGIDRRTFHRINNERGWFEPVGEPSGRLAQPYRLTPQYHSDQKKLLSIRGQIRRIDGTKLGPITRTPRKHGKLIEVDVDRLMGLVGIHDAAAKFLHFANAPQCGTNSIPVYQYKLASGRIQQCGPTGLQYAPKSVRRAALAGRSEYDISNSHYNLCFHFAGMNGVTLEGFGAYATLPNDYREEIAVFTGTTVKKVKVALQSLVYGSPVPTPDAQYRAEKQGYQLAIAELLGSAKAAKFTTHPLVAAIASEVSTLKKLAGVTNRRQLSTFIQGIEAFVLDTATDGLEVTCPLFDGFVTPDDVDTEMLHDRCAAVGYPLKWEKTEL